MCWRLGIKGRDQSSFLGRSTIAHKEVTMTTCRKKTAVLAAAIALAASGLIAATAPANAATVRACTNAALAVSHSSSQSGLGHSSFVLLFKNTSSSTCTLY